MSATICLTFDDGPDPLWTPRILTALRRRGARATFFVQARRATKHADATRMLAAEHDLRLWGWNVDTHDWRGDDVRRMFGALQAQGGLRGGDVILMHDALGPGARRDGCPHTVALTELLLATAERAELIPSTVSESEGVLA